MRAPPQASRTEPAGIDDHATAEELTESHAAMSYGGALPPIAIDGTRAPTASEQAYGEPLYDKATPGAPTEETKQPNPRAEFDRLTQRGIHEKDVPNTITIPQASQDGLGRAWDRSANSEHKHEQGGNLVRNANHSYGFRDGVEGKDDTFKPDPDDVGKGQALVGYAHTHGYADGNEDVTFSGDDIAGIVRETQPINLLISGKTQFVIARTAEFDKLVKDLDDDQADALEAKINDMWNKEFFADKKPLQQRAERATLKVCHAYHLAYYRGSGGTLKHQ